MHQKVFGSLALAEPAGGAYSTPPDPLTGLARMRRRRMGK